MAPTSRGARGRGQQEASPPSNHHEEEDVVASTLESLEGLGLHQLTSLETCNSIIAGDFQDYGDTTDLPKAQVRTQPHHPLVFVALPPPLRYRIDIPYLMVLYRPVMVGYMSQL